MLILLRLGITAFIIAMFFMANHMGGSISQQIFRILGTIGMFQITAMYYLWRTYAAQIQSMIDQGNVTDEFDKKEFYRSAAASFAIALGLSVILFVPNVIAIGLVWILSYSLVFCSVFVILGKYITVRSEVKRLKEITGRMLNDSTKKGAQIKGSEV